MLRAWPWAPALLATLCWTAVAAADIAAEPEPIRLRYLASEGCPSREIFLEKLRAHTLRFHEANEGEASRVFAIELASAAETSKGRLTVSARDGSSATRDVRASTCDQVVAALALVVAVAIDPQALSGAPPITPEPDLPPVRPPNAAPNVHSPDGGSTEAAPRALRSALGLRWDEVSGLTPLVRPVLRPFIELTADRSGVLVPAFRISFAWTRDAHVATAVNGAELSWYVARAEACPFRLGSAAASLTLCAIFDAGALRLVGQGAPSSTARTRPWLSAGLNTRASARLWRWVFAELEIGAAAPWIKDRWLFADGSNLHTAPALSLWTGAGLGCRFP